MPGQATTIQVAGQFVFGFSSTGTLACVVFAIHVTLTANAGPLKAHSQEWLCYHNKDLKRRTLASIIEQEGLITAEFADLL